MDDKPFKDVTFQTGFVLFTKIRLGVANNYCRDVNSEAYKMFVNCWQLVILNYICTRLIAK